MDKPDYKNLQDYEDFKIILNQNDSILFFN